MMADTSEQEDMPSEERGAAHNLRDRPSSRAMLENGNHNQGEGEGVWAYNCGTPPLKMQGHLTPAATDNNSTDTKLSGSSGGIICPRHKDPDRIKKDREREERVRQAREKLEEERKKKLIELKEQQRQAQENREKQIEMRKKKIEDLRRREMERRAEVEKRRQEKETLERSRRETLLLKAEERVARYEAWKRGGQKGLPPGSAMPTTKQLSVSTSVLYHKRHSDFSSSGVLNTSNRPESLLALNTIPEGRRSVLAPPKLSTSRPKSVMNIASAGLGSGGGVKLRERPSPRKPRPASVAGSVPTVVSVTDSPKSLSQSRRSKSTDRLSREHPQSRGTVSASGTEDSSKEQEKKPLDKPGVKMSRKTLDRLSTPRQGPNVGDGDRRDSASSPRPEPNHGKKSSLREKSKEAPGKQQTPKEAPVRPHKPKDTPSKAPQQQKTSASPSPNIAGPAASSTPRTNSPSQPISIRVLSPTTGADEDGGTALSRSSPTPIDKPEETPHPETGPTPLETSAVEVSQPCTSPTPPEKLTAEVPEAYSSPVPVEQPALAEAESHSTPIPMEKSKVETPQFQSTSTPGEKSTGDITADEYKARLAEKRRQAREKAEREAEEERRRKEEEERLEEERRRQEDEEQRRREEEAIGLAEEARKAEEERLQKAIEAEEARKAEEAARLEQERLAKEEAERKAREDAERLEQERQEKARREEEERLERKKRLEMIMKRVKTDNTGEGAKDSPRAGGSPARNLGIISDSTQAAALNTPIQSESSEERKRSMDSNAEESRSPVYGARSPANAASPIPFATSQESTSLSQASSQENMLDSKEGSTPTSSRSHSPAFTSRISALETDKPKFKSPLLQKLVDGKDDTGSLSGEGPRFKSPLLQNILSKTRVGARMGLTQQDYSRSSPDLSQMESPSRGVLTASSSSAMVMSASMMDMDTSSSASRERLSKNSINSASKEELNRNEEKDVDTSQNSSSTHFSPARKALAINGDLVQESLSSSVWRAQDSGVSLGAADLYSLGPAMSLSLNGHDLDDAAYQGQSLEESGIGLQPTDSTASHEHSTDDRNFEELIDLSISNTSTTSTLLTYNSDELMSFTKLEEGSEDSIGLPPPIIAFEETSMLKHQDVSDLLS